jgi:hypothetical protein
MVIGAGNLKQARVRGTRYENKIFSVIHKTVPFGLRERGKND